MSLPRLCRECGLIAGANSLASARFDSGGQSRRDLRCPACGSPRIIEHAELLSLSIAHIDCDAFYASVEKRDRPELVNRPVIVGGGKRGVVAACCYLARMSGVKSAMPMFKALEACPDAVVLAPEMSRYREAGYAIRALMKELTPVIEPIALDEAFLDLGPLMGKMDPESGEKRLPARELALLIRRIETEIGVTASVGLAPNKLLAKMASELDKPRGYAVVGKFEAQGFLATRPVRDLWGVGPSMQNRLAADGIHKVGDLLNWQPAALAARYGSIGRQLHAFALGHDTRRVQAEQETRSISNEITFEIDISDPGILADRLWTLSEKVAGRMKLAGFSGWTVTIKLKRPDFTLVTRSKRLSRPSQLAEKIYRAGNSMLEKELDAGPGQAWRLIGIGVSDLLGADAGDPPDLFDFAMRQDHPGSDKVE